MRIPEESYVFFLLLFALALDAKSTLAQQEASRSRPATAHQEDGIRMPKIVGDWWTIAQNPDLGRYNSPEQEPTAFGIWKAVDGTWQLWGCIRKTNVGGKSRLFYRWQGNAITDTNWVPMGIAMIADSSFGETPGGLQTPHVTKIANEYFMVYGDWENICLARSQDGKTFARQLNLDGMAGMFNEGWGNGTRDPMLTAIGNTYHIYYTAHPDKRGAIYCRTSTDLRNWSSSQIVSFGASAGKGWTDAEVPYVLYLPVERAYYLFRTHSVAGSNEYMTSVYRSRDPLDFGIDDDKCLVARLPTEAAWILNDDGDYYIASVIPGFQGYRVAHLKWTYSSQ
jgi:hypothetical protein